MKLSIHSRIFVTIVSVAGLSVLAFGISTREPFATRSFLILLAAALVSARFKVSLPKLNGSMSVTLPFLLIALSQLGFLAALIVACASVLAQSIGFGKRPQPVQVLFNSSTVAIAMGACHFVVGQLPAQAGLAGSVLAIAVSCGVYFLANTVPVAAIIAMTEAKKVVKVWKEVFLWSFPYYVVSAGLASMVISLNRQIWEMTLAVLLIAFGLYRCFSHASGKQHEAGNNLAELRSAAANS